jgi:hypothetical protein
MTSLRVIGRCARHRKRQRATLAARTELPTSPNQRTVIIRQAFDERVQSHDLCGAVPAHAKAKLIHPRGTEVQRWCWEAECSGADKLCGTRRHPVESRPIGRGLTENVVMPACSQHESRSHGTRAASSADLNNLHGPWFGKGIA